MSDGQVLNIIIHAFRSNFACKTRNDDRCLYQYTTSSKLIEKLMNNFNSCSRIGIVCRSGICNIYWLYKAAYINEHTILFIYINNKKHYVKLKHFIKIKLKMSILSLSRMKYLTKGVTLIGTIQHSTARRQVHKCTNHITYSSHTWKIYDCIIIFYFPAAKRMVFPSFFFLFIFLTLFFFIVSNMFKSWLQRPETKKYAADGKFI